MTRFIAILERDLRKFLRNPLVVAVSVVMPILYLVILGSSFQGELKNLPLAVVRMDNGPYAARMIEALRSIEAGPRTLSVALTADQGRAMRGLRDGEFKGVLVIPDGFSRAAARAGHYEGGQLGLFLDNSDPISSAALRSSVSAAAAFIKTEFVPTRTDEVTLLRTVDIYRKIDYDQTLIPGVVIMAIFLGAMTTGAFNLVMDRFLGVDESYFLTPLTKRDIVMGLTVSGLFITTMLAAAVLVLASLISGVRVWSALSWEGLLLLAGVIILTTLAMQGLMFVVMGRINHPRIVGVLGGFLNVIFFFPSGAIYPVESFPGWLKAFSVVNPETYSVRAIKALLYKGVGYNAVAWDLGALLLFATVFIALGTATFKRTL